MATPVLYGDPGRLLKAADGRPVYLLTYPAEDADGDLVRPEGGRWAGPVLVNVEHACPVGTAAVALRTLKSLPGRLLPVGTTTFGFHEDAYRGLALGGYSPAQCVDEAHSTATLVAKGVMDGVSAEFTPTVFKSRGFKSPRWDRPAYDVDEWDLLALAHCSQPVQHHARLLVKAVPLADAALDFARTAAGSGRFPGGGIISPVCRKALATLVAGLPRPPAAARGVTPGGPAVPTLIPKALPADDTDDEYLPADEVPADLDAVDEPAAEEAEAGAELTPTPAAFAQVAQLTSDLIAAIDAALAKSEHPEGRARLEEFRAMLADEAGSLLDDGRGMFPEAGLDAPAGAAEADMDKAFKLPRAKDGTLLCKAFPKGPPLRFRLADLGPAEPPAAQLTKAAEVKADRLFRDATRLKRKLAVAR